MSLLGKLMGWKDGEDYYSRYMGDARPATPDPKERANDGPDLNLYAQYTRDQSYRYMTMADGPLGHAPNQLYGDQTEGWMARPDEFRPESPGRVIRSAWAFDDPGLPDAARIAPVFDVMPRVPYQNLADVKINPKLPTGSTQQTGLVGNKQLLDSFIGGAPMMGDYSSVGQSAFTANPN